MYSHLKPSDIPFSATTHEVKQNGWVDSSHISAYTLHLQVDRHLLSMLLFCAHRQLVALLQAFRQSEKHVSLHDLSHAIIRYFIRFFHIESGRQMLSQWSPTCSSSSTFCTNGVEWRASSAFATTPCSPPCPSWFVLFFHTHTCIFLERKTTTQYNLKQLEKVSIGALFAIVRGVANLILWDDSCYGATLDKVSSAFACIQENTRIVTSYLTFYSGFERYCCLY